MSTPGVQTRPRPAPPDHLASRGRVRGARLTPTLRAVLDDRGVPHPLRIHWRPHDSTPSRARAAKLGSPRRIHLASIFSWPAARELMQSPVTTLLFLLANGALMALLVLYAEFGWVLVFPMLALLASGVLYLLLQALIAHQLRTNRALHLCLACDHDLEGVPPSADGGVVCPECGAAWVLPGPEAA